VLPARDMYNHRTPLLRFTQQQLAVLTHHELPIAQDFAPFHIFQVPNIQHELTSPCWKITLALHDPSRKGDKVVAEGAFVLSWRIVREYGEIEQVLVLRRVNDGHSLPDMRLTVRVSKC